MDAFTKTQNHVANAADLVKTLPCIDCGDPVPLPGSPWPPFPEVVEFLGKHQETLALCDEAARKGGKALLPRRRGPHDFGLVDWQSEHRMLCWLVEVRAAAELYQQQPDKAFQSILTLQALARSIENQPTVNDSAIVRRYLSTRNRLIVELCSQRRVEADFLKELQEMLASEDLLGQFRRGLASERAYGIDILMRPVTTVAAYWPERIAYLDMMEELCGACDQGWPGLRKLADPCTPAKERGVLTDQARKALVSLIPSLIRVESGRQLTLVALAARRFHLGEGRVPTSIDDLVGDYLTHRPVDWVEEGSTRLELEGNDIVVSCKTESKNRVDKTAVPSDSLEIRVRLPP
jgi:hypothetical protein